MINKLKIYWQNLISRYGKEKIYLCLGLIGVIILTLWIAQTSPTTIADQKMEPEELGVIIPTGYLVVPLELANANSLNGLVNKQAVIDVLQAKNPVPVVEALRVLKLAAGEGPLFGALVPERMAGPLQDLSSKGNLRGALRNNKSLGTRFHIKEISQKTSLYEIQTGE